MGFFILFAQTWHLKIYSIQFSNDRVCIKNYYFRIINEIVFYVLFVSHLKFKQYWGSVSLCYSVNNLRFLDDFCFSDGFINVNDHGDFRRHLSRFQMLRARFQACMFSDIIVLVTYFFIQWNDRLSELMYVFYGFVYAYAKVTILEWEFCHFYFILYLIHVHRNIFAPNAYLY